MCDPHSLPRREFVQGGVGAAAALAGLQAFRLPTWRELEGVERPYLEVALEAARWIGRARVRTDGGVTWPADPNEPGSVGTTFYTHSPGVVTFLLELFHSTGDEQFLDEAKGGADHLATAVDDDRVGSTGLYTGLAGIAFVMEETYRASGDAAYRGHAERCITLIQQRAKPVGEGMAWPEATGSDGSLEVNDIISGTAGTALGLLYADRMMGHPDAVELALQAGQRLVELGIPAGPGRRWEMWPSYEREMPNFSHGTAGISYFLAALYRRTGRREFLDSARQGAAYLRSIATGDADSYVIYHHAPDGKDLYYLGWCHGPVGTNCLFYELGRATGDDEVMQWVHMGARGFMGSGIPEVRTPGFWNNISQCCGSAGVGGHCLKLHRLSGNAEYRAFADRITSDLLERSTETAGGRKWIQAEHRVRPEFLIAQTGYMQGAAGVGTYFLHRDAAERGERPRIELPDSPFHDV
jgi:lantibiotic modifying enzyme